MKLGNFSPKAVAAIQPLKQELRRFFLLQNRHVSDLELAMEIERRFGDLLIEKVCKVLGLDDGGCWHLAIAAAKGEI